MRKRAIRVFSLLVVAVAGAGLIGLFCRPVPSRPPATPQVSGISRNQKGSGIRDRLQQKAVLYGVACNQEARTPEKEIPLQSSPGQQTVDTNRCVGLSNSESGLLCRRLLEALRAGNSGDATASGIKLAALGEVAVPDMAILLNSGDAVIETQAFSLLVQIGGTKAVALCLGKIMSETDLNYRASLIGYLACLRSREGIDAMVKMMLENDQPVLRNTIMTVLSSMEGGIVASAIADASAKVESKTLAEPCAVVLARLKSPSNVPGLATVLDHATDNELAESAAIALASIGNDSACTALSDRAQSGSKVAELCNAALSLVSSPFGQLTLLKISRDPEKKSVVRVAAITALANQQSSYVRDELQKVLTQEKSVEVVKTLEQSIKTLDEHIAAIKPTCDDHDSSGSLVETPSPAPAR